MRETITAITSSRWRPGCESRRSQGWQQHDHAAGSGKSERTRAKEHREFPASLHEIRPALPVRSFCRRIPAGRKTMPRSKTPTVSLEEIKARFEERRRTRKVKASIPDDLWAADVALARKEGVSRTSELRVDWNHLKRRMAKRVNHVILSAWYCSRIWLGAFGPAAFANSGAKSKTMEATATTRRNNLRP